MDQIDLSKAEAFEALINSKEQVLIFTHDFPDPDAMSSALGLRKLIEDHFDKPVTLFGAGCSRPQNKVMANVLNIGLKNAQDTLLTLNTQNLAIIFVDVNENSGNLKFKRDFGLKPDWTIDHHVDKDKPLSGPNVHLEPVGSTATIITEYLQHFGVKFAEDNKNDADVATGLLLGLMTDTNNMLSTAVTPRDLAAFDYLKKHYNQETFAAIMDFELSAYYFDLMLKAHETYTKEGSLIVLSLGYIREDQEGAISFAADLWRRWKDVRVVVAFAIIGDTVTGKVRMKGTSDIGASDLARQVFKSPNGGGHAHAAGATGELGSFFGSGLETLDEETKNGFLKAITTIIVQRAKKLSQE